MKFVKGMIMGTLISAGMVMIWSDTMSSQRKRMMKKGKQFVRKMGMM